MSFEDMLQFQLELEKAEKELAKIEKEALENKKEDFGYAEVLKEREKQKELLKQRLLSINFSEKEIAKLLKIVTNTEEEMDKIKKSYNFNKQIPGQSVKMQQDLLEAQKKMKITFDAEFDKILKSKHKK